MFRKSTILALAAVASLGTVALSSTSASAFGHFGGARFSGPHFSTAHFGGSAARVVHPSFTRIVRVPPRVWPPHHWHTWGHRYWFAPVVVAAGVATYAATPTGQCTCLTKEYTTEGAVVFKDVCTNEMAMNPAENPAPAADTMPPQSPRPHG